MKAIKTTFILLILLPMLCIGAASTNQSIQLHRYFQASCPSYTGTWKGFFTDPTGLFGSGGPWPITVSLYNKEDKLIGLVNSNQAPNFVANAITGKLWAQCNNGILHNIFVGKQNQCGSFSQSGMLVSKNMLVLEVNYENAMTGTTFLLFLKRVNNKYEGAIPTNIKAMILKPPTTCH